MRRRVIGAALTIVGVLTVLFAPAWGVVGCASCVEGYDNPMCGCYEFTTALAVPINWPTEPVGVDLRPSTVEWDKLFLPMLIIGVAVVGTGIVLLIKPRRFFARRH